MREGEHITNGLASGFVLVPDVHSRLPQVGSQLAVQIVAPAPWCRIAFRSCFSIMPQHDLPDGRESDSNMTDFRKRLRRRAETSAPNTDPRSSTNWIGTPTRGVRGGRLPSSSAAKAFRY